VETNNNITLWVIVRTDLVSMGYFSRISSFFCPAYWCPHFSKPAPFLYNGGLASIKGGTLDVKSI
jgi:hypothetical protein